MTSNYTCRFDDDLYQRLNDLGETKELPLAYIIRQACHEYLNNQNKTTNQAEEALIWIDIRTRSKWYDGLDPDELQEISNGIYPLLARIIPTKRGVAGAKIQCPSEHDIWGRCFMNEGYHEYHMVFNDGTQCLWPYETTIYACCGEGEACSSPDCTGYPKDCRC